MSLFLVVWGWLSGKVTLAMFGSGPWTGTEHLCVQISSCIVSVVLLCKAALLITQVMTPTPCRQSGCSIGAFGRRFPDSGRWRCCGGRPTAWFRYATRATDEERHSYYPHQIPSTHWKPCHRSCASPSYKHPVVVTSQRYRNS